jgi:dipeptidyl aminopeptidase/acylaminoacyl peptidase
MRDTSLRWGIALGSVIGLCSADPLAGQTGGRPLPVEDYDRWRTIESVELSGDGAWVTYAYGHRVGDDTLQVRNLTDGSIHRLPRATDPAFSDDSRWLAYRIVPPFEEARQLRREEEPMPQEIGLLDLRTGEQVSWKGGASFAFANGSGRFAIRKAGARPDAGPGGRDASPGRRREARDGQVGTDLIVRDLEAGVDLLLGNVSGFEFNEAGNLLAYTVDAAEGAGNGLYLLRLEMGVLETLDQTPLRYARLTWDRSGTALAVLRGSREDTLTERANALVAFTGLDDVHFEAARFEPSPELGFPEGMILSERGALSWREDGSAVFGGIKEQRVALVDDPDNPRPNVDVFHWRDDRIQTVQRARAEADRNFTYRAAIDLESGRLVPLADSSMRTVTLTADGVWGVGRDDRAYISDWKEARADYYRVHTSTGERTPMLEAQGRTLGLSPDGKHFAYWREGDVWIYALETGLTRNLTASAPVSFVNEQYDRPGTKPPYGLAGWTADGTAMVLNHRYDLWLQPLDGSPPTNLTSGRGARDEIRFRIVRLDPDEQAIDLDRPLLLSAYGDWTKKSGFFRLSRREGANEGNAAASVFVWELTELLFDDRQFAGLRKAAGAERYLFTSSTFAEFPDLYVSDGRFDSPERITDANPQQAEYAWGHRILFEYENEDGVRLQGTLAIPDSYQAGQRLPMIVNFYDKKSPEMHRYYAPRFESGYPSGNPGPVAELGAYVSNGYLVMQADVHFNTRTTHSDMLDCVTAATRKVIEMGYADPDRIALVGGSFSGGGSAFIATRTDMFAAVVARAAPINLAGEFNVLFSGSGQNNHSYDIYGQGRYGTNPFDDFELYREQSPITHVQTMNTPLLYLHGKLDGSVEYLQGMEFYNALRFLGKPIIFLSYPDEGHNLRRYENQRDFVERLWQFLDHHLKGAPAPDWMTKGVRFLDRGY